MNNPVVWTTVVSLIIAAIGTIGLPMFVNRSKSRETTEDRKSVDSREVAKMFKEERDRLQTRLDTMQAEYERRIHEMRVENAQALARAQTTITGLREEIQSLYRQLYQQQPPRSGP